MAFSQPPAPITDDDDAIRVALEDAEVPALLPALAYLTGDLTVLRDDIAPDPTMVIQPQGGLTAEQLAEGRRVALDVLIAFRDGACVAAPRPSDDDLVRMLEWPVGGEAMAEYVPLFREELGIAGEDLRAPSWHTDDVAPDREFRVAIVGAGMSGIVAAHRLGQAGIPYVVLEKNDDVGGTWLDNTYPGCRVDVSNHLYSYSFAQRDDWPQHFSTQDELLAYFRRCADEFGVHGHTRFGTEVTSMAWDDDRATWTLCLDTPDGEDTIEAHAVISAVGQLNRPRMPDIAGQEDFAGDWFHSARWDHGVDVRGKRVAVIGTGASGIQFITSIVDEAGEMTVFQRTAPWLVPTPEYHDEVPDGTTWLFRHVPGYAQWYRFWLFWRNAEGILAAAKVDPDWDGGERSVSQMNEMVRMLLTGYLEGEFADRPDLLDRVVPDYPPVAKRVIRDNGVWARSLKADHVDLVTDPIDRIVASGVRTADGTVHEADVLIYGTGFTASDFLMPMKVVGRGGVDLHEAWDGDARAYMGITIPGFPNLFTLYGPNTNIVINGSIIYFSECETHYVLECIRTLLADDHRALDVKRDVHDAYNEWIDEGNRAMAWGASSVNTWYKNAKGRVTQNWPYSLLDYWKQTRSVDPEAYDWL